MTYMYTGAGPNYPARAGFASSIEYVYLSLSFPFARHTWKLLPQSLQLLLLFGFSLHIILQNTHSQTKPYKQTNKQFHLVILQLTLSLCCASCLALCTSCSMNQSGTACVYTNKHTSLFTLLQHSCLYHITQTCKRMMPSVWMHT